MRKKLYIIIAFTTVIVFFYLLFSNMKTFPNSHINKSIPTETRKNPVQGDENAAITSVQEESRHLNDEYNFMWSFYSGLKYSSAIDFIGDTVLIYAHDGQLSGYHEDEYLYGVDKNEGKKIWSVYGGFLPIKYSIDEKNGYIFISTLKNDAESKTLFLELQSLKIGTGEKQWTKKLPNVDSMNNISFSQGTVNIEYINNDNHKKLFSINSKNGQTNWEIELAAEETLYTRTRELPSIVIQGEDYLKAVDPFSRQEIWRLKGKIVIPPDRNNLINTINNRIETDLASNLLEWVIYNNEIVLLDITSGSIKNKLPITNCRNYYYLDDKSIYVLAGESIDRQHNYLFVEGFKDFVFDDYININQMEIYNDNFIYVNNNKLYSFSIKERKVMWSVNIGFSGDKEKCIDLFYLDDLVYVMSNSNIYIFNADTGKNLGKLIEYSYDSNASNLLLLPGYIYKMTKYNDMVFIPRQDGYVDCFRSKKGTGNNF
ncbi:MAG: hypothetical protein FIA99_10285 [Ruminiclostridium sp.]|nr:hypothetical protein [Ruminiclostridium sp.]